MALTGWANRRVVEAVDDGEKLRAYFAAFFYGATFGSEPDLLQRHTLHFAEQRLDHCLVVDVRHASVHVSKAESAADRAHLLSEPWGHSALRVL